VLLFGTATAVLSRLVPKAGADAALVSTLLVTFWAGVHVAIDDLGARTGRCSGGRLADGTAHAGHAGSLLIISVLSWSSIQGRRGRPSGEAWKAVAMNAGYFVTSLLVVVFGIDSVTAWWFVVFRGPPECRELAGRSRAGHPAAPYRRDFLRRDSRGVADRPRVPIDRFPILPVSLLVVTALSWCCAPGRTSRRTAG
jgi:hypothetical protein